ncbi:MAG: hypothetical protein ACM3MG_00705 [Bacillota bacterium]
MKAILSLFLGSLITVSFSTTQATTTTTLDSPSTSSEIVISNGPQINAAYYNYYFGNVAVNSSRYHRFILTNDTGRPVFVNNVVLWGNGFRGWNHCYGWLYPWQRCSTQVEFHPWYQGSYSGQLAFYISSGNIFVNLYGWGVYR